MGAGKTLTALATVVRLAEYIAQAGGARNGTLVMLPTKALVKESNLTVSPLYLHHISPISPLHLHNISPISPLYRHYIGSVSDTISNSVSDSVSDG